jgi:hypothetical protein
MPRSRRAEEYGTEMSVTAEAVTPETLAQRRASSTGPAVRCEYDPQEAVVDGPLYEDERPSGNEVLPRVARVCRCERSGL